MTTYTEIPIDPPTDSDTLRALQEYRIREQAMGFAEAICARCKQYPGKPARQHEKLATRVCGNCRYVEIRNPREVAR